MQLWWAYMFKNMSKSNRSKCSVVLTVVQVMLKYFFYKIIIKTSCICKKFYNNNGLKVACRAESVKNLSSFEKTKIFFFYLQPHNLAICACTLFLYFVPNTINVTMNWAVHLNQMRGYTIKSTYCSARIICWLHGWNKTHSLTYQRQIDRMLSASPEFLPWAKGRLTLSVERFSMPLIQRPQASIHTISQHCFHIKLIWTICCERLLWRGLWPGNDLRRKQITQGCF